MLFNSFAFLIFFPFVATIYFVLPQPSRWCWLLITSCFFYMYFIPIYILILGFTIVMDYLAGLYIESAAGPRKKWGLILSIMANLGMLAYFKYFNFFCENI